MGYTVVQIADRVRTEADAYRFIEELRWSDGEAVCPHCGNVGASYIRPLNGCSRKTRTGAMSERRVWRCFECRKQFSVITGTVFHGTKVSLRIWVLVIFEMCASKNGVAAREIERKYGVCARTAWHMMHRLREAMMNDPVVPLMSGVVMADETWIGGSVKNFKRSKRAERGKGPGGGHSPGENKVSVLTLIDSATGEARSRVIPDVTGHTLRKAIAEQVDMGNTTLFTDEAAAYRTFDWELAGHEAVNHSNDQYVRYQKDRIITSNAVEGFFSQLKRSIDGTHHHVSREHLHRYLGEFDFRYTTREMTDTVRMGVLVGQAEGRRLTYKRVKTH